MLFKLIVLSPFELPYSSNRGRYNVGDLIQFDIRNKEHVQHLLRLLNDVQYSRYIQPLQKLPDNLGKEFDQSIKSTTVKDTSVFIEPDKSLLKETDKEKLNKILQPLTSSEEKIIAEQKEEEVQKEKVEYIEPKQKVDSIEDKKEARFNELDKLHWATLRKLAEDEYNLEYDKFDKDIVIADILDADFPD